MDTGEWGVLICKLPFKCLLKAVMYIMNQGPTEVRFPEDDPKSEMTNFFNRTRTRRLPKTEDRRYISKKNLLEQFLDRDQLTILYKNKNSMNSISCKGDQNFSLIILFFFLRSIQISIGQKGYYILKCLHYKYSINSNTLCP